MIAIIIGCGGLDGILAQHIVKTNLEEMDMDIQLLKDLIGDMLCEYDEKLFEFDGLSVIKDLEYRLNDTDYKRIEKVYIDKRREVKKIYRYKYLYGW